MKVSVVLPTYNESGNIAALVTEILAGGGHGYDLEVLVVDDNSPDGTYRCAAEAFAGNAAVVPILRLHNRGLANSIREGLEKSTGDLIIIMDTDFTHDPKEIRRFVHLLGVSDLVVGSRFCPGGSMEDVPHYLCSLAYNWFARVILRTQIQDNLSGFLGLSRDCLAKLPFDEIFWGYGDYCFRLLHYAQRNHARVLEMPVQYKTRQKGESKSAFSKLLFSYTRELVKLRAALNKEQGDKA